MVFEGRKRKLGHLRLDKCNYRVTITTIPFRFYPAREGRPSQCYLFKTCGRNVVSATYDCQLNKENTIEVKPFVQSDGECKLLCQQVSSFVLDYLIT